MHARERCEMQCANVGIGRPRGVTGQPIRRDRETPTEK